MHLNYQLIYGDLKFGTTFWDSEYKHKLKITLNTRYVYLTWRLKI